MGRGGVTPRVLVGVAVRVGVTVRVGVIVLLSVAVAVIAGVMVRVGVIVRVGVAVPVGAVTGALINALGADAPTLLSTGWMNSSCRVRLPTASSV